MLERIAFRGDRGWLASDQSELAARFCMLKKFEPISTRYKDVLDKAVQVLALIGAWHRTATGCGLLCFSALYIVPPCPSWWMKFTIVLAARVFISSGVGSCLRRAHFVRMWREVPSISWQSLHCPESSNPIKLRCLLSLQWPVRKLVRSLRLFLANRVTFVFWLRTFRCFIQQGSGRFL
jgi:hypothetical protein